MATAVLGLGVVLRLALAAYAFGGRSASMLAVAWQGDAALSAVQSAVAWYLSYLLVRMFGSHAALYAACAALWMAVLLAFWVPDVAGLLGLRSGKTDKNGKVTALQGQWHADEAQWQGRLRLGLAVLPAFAIVTCMWDDVWPEGLWYAHTR